MATARPLSIGPANRVLIGAVLALALLGAAAVYSALAFEARVKAGGDPDSLILKHIVLLAGGLGLAWVSSYLNYRWMERVSLLALVGSVGALVAVFVMGKVTGGAQRWIPIAGFQFQPSEVAKLALVIHTAVLLAKKQPYITDYAKSFVPLAFWAGLVLVLIGTENLSMALVTGSIIGLMWIVGRVPLLHIASAVPVVALLAGLLLLNSPERMNRLTAFAQVFTAESHAERDVQGEDYQSYQAQIAIARGGLFGVGPGKSVQRDFLPEAHNDFVFAIIVEEYGLLVAAGVMGLFALILFQGFLRIARPAPDPFGLFLAVGLTCLIVCYGFVNAGVASGLLPVTGLTMPFVSYGGTSLLVMGLVVGLLLNISRQVNLALIAPTSDSPAIRTRKKA